MNLFDAKKVDIAVIGVTMAGKSTYIASLFSEGINEKLRIICLDNTKGQTKITTFYRLEECGDLRISGVGISQEHWSRSSDEIKEKLRKYLLITADEENGFNKDSSKEDECVLEKNLTNIEEFYSQIINSGEVMDSEVITKVIVSGAAAENVWKSIRDFGLEEVVIRDTRGLMDETEEFEKRYEKVNRIKNKKMQNSDDIALPKDNGSNLEEEEMLKALINERGIEGADACIFMTSGGREALGAENQRARYGFILKEIIQTMMVAVVAQDQNLSEKLWAIQKEKRFETYLDWLGQGVDENYNFMADKLYWGSGSCRSVRELLVDMGLFQQGDPDRGYNAELLKKHYRQYLVAQMIDYNEHKEMYWDTVHASFRKVLEEVASYKKELLSWMEGRTLDGLEKAFLKVFEDYYWNLKEHGGALELYNRNGMACWETGLSDYYVDDLTDKIEKSLRERKDYKGFDDVNGNYVFRMKGKRGGLTTWTPDGRVGRYSFDLLEHAYSTFIHLREECVKNFDNYKKDGGTRLSEREKQFLSDILEAVRINSFAYYSCSKAMLKPYMLWSILDSIEDKSTGNGASADAVVEERKRNFGDSYSNLNLIYLILYGLIEQAFVEAKDKISGISKKT